MTVPDKELVLLKLILIVERINVDAERRRVRLCSEEDVELDAEMK